MKYKQIALIFNLALACAGLVSTGVANADGHETFESRITVIQDDESSKRLCSETQETMYSCYAFIKGFLKGALLTDAAIIDSIEGSAEGSAAKLSYSERATKTRLGKRNASPTALAGFCLPVDQSISDLSKDILSHIKGSQINSLELAKNVYNSLKVDYPCQE